MIVVSPSPPVRRKARGFSLYEVVASIAILAVIHLAVASLQAVSLRGARDQFENEMARTLAQQLVSEVANRRYDSEFPVDQEGLREIDGVTYRWSIRYAQISAAPSPSYVRKATVELHWVGREGPDTLTLSAIVCYPLVANPPPPPAPSPGPMAGGS